MPLLSFLQERLRGRQSSTASQSSPISNFGRRIARCEEKEGNTGEHYVTPEKYLDGAQIPTFFQFQSNLVTDEDLQPGMVRQLEVDKRLTLPVRTHVRIL